MAEEEKKVETETTEETSEKSEKTEEVETKTDTEETKESKEETEESSEENTTKEEKIDYKAELEEEEKLTKPDPNKAREAYQERKEKRESKEEEEIEEEEVKPEDKPMTVGQFNTWQKQNRETEADTFAGNLATGDEKKLTLIKWKNRIWPSNMPLSQQIEESWVLANSKAIIGREKEALRALASKDKVNTDASASREAENQASGGQKLSAGDKVVMVETGFTLNKTTKLWEKKLKNGTVLIRDPETGAVNPRGAILPPASEIV